MRTVDERPYEPAAHWLEQADIVPAELQYPAGHRPAHVAAVETGELTQ